MEVVSGQVLVHGFIIKNLCFYLLCTLSERQYDDKFQKNLKGVWCDLCRHEQSGNHSLELKYQDIKYLILESSQPA